MRGAVLAALGVAAAVDGSSAPATQNPLRVDETAFALRSACAPQIAGGSTGPLHVVWLSSIGGRWQVFHRSVDAARGAFASPQARVSEWGNASNPRVALGAAGSVHAVWRAFDGESEAIVANASLDGATWSPENEQRIEGSLGCNFVGDPEIAGDATGRAFAIWTQRREAADVVMFARWTPETARWSRATALHPSPGPRSIATSPRIACDGRGRVYAAYLYDEDPFAPRPRRELWVRASADGGATFSSASNVHAGESIPIDLSLASGDAGHVVVAYSSRLSDGSTRVEARCNPAAGAPDAWIGGRPPTTRPKGAMELRPVATVDERGTAYVAMQTTCPASSHETRGSSTLDVAVLRPEAQAWEECFRIPLGIGDAAFAGHQIASAGSRVAVTWVDAREGLRFGSVASAHSTDCGRTWSPPSAVEGDGAPTRLPGFPSLALAPRGIGIAWDARPAADGATPLATRRGAPFVVVHWRPLP